jgi:hypothetical protein
MEYVIGITLVIVGMGAVFFLVRALAKLVIVVVLLVAIVATCCYIDGENPSYQELSLYAVLAGAIAGVLCIPVLPYSGLDFLTRDDDNGSKRPIRSKQTEEPLKPFGPRRRLPTSESQQEPNKGPE